MATLASEPEGKTAHNLGVSEHISLSLEGYHSHARWQVQDFVPGRTFPARARSCDLRRFGPGTMPSIVDPLNLLMYRCLQIVRTDLKELIDMDIKGAPCNFDDTDMMRRRSLFTDSYQQMLMRLWETTGLKWRDSASGRQDTGKVRIKAH